jgi:hypothetical protein
MEKRYYTAASLKDAMEAFESGYAMSTEDFYRAHVEEDEPAIAHVARRHRPAWAMFYRSWKRMTSGDAFAQQVKRELEPA